MLSAVIKDRKRLDSTDLYGDGDNEGVREIMTKEGKVLRV